MATDFELFSEATDAVFGHEDPPLKVKERYPEGHRYEKMNDFIPRLVRSLLDEAKESPTRKPGRTLPEIIGGTHDSSLIDAVAFAHGRRYFIGLSEGVSYQLARIFDNLLCHAEVFPWIGAPTREGGRFESWHPPAGPSDRHRPVTQARPIDPKREELSFIMSTRSLGAIIFHEFRHIVGGHLDFPIQSSQIPCSMNESISLMGDEQSGMESQALEWDADMMAVVATLSNFLAYHCGEHPDNPEYHEYFPDPRHALEASLLCIDTFLKVFEFDDYRGPQEWPLLSHPPTLIRRHMAAYLAIIYRRDMKSFNEIPEEECYAIRDRVFKISDEITSTMFGMRPGLDYQSIPESTLMAHWHRIHRTLTELDPVLEAHRYYDFGTDRFLRRRTP